jgi:outer membrane protein OmpA-like peptidoglycan-associated protein
MVADPGSTQTDDQDPADPNSPDPKDGGPPPPAAAANADPAPTQFGSAGGKAGQLPDPDTYAPLIGTTTGTEFNTIRAAIIPFACWRVDDMRFAFNQSIPDPGLAVEMENLADLMATHPGCVLGVFGHADPVGSDDLNKHLSGRRAAAIYGLLTGRTEIWNDLYTDGGVFAKPTPGDVWGEKSLQMMLSTLGRSDDVAGFTRNPANRLGLFSDYMAQISGPVGVLPKERFLGRGEDPAGKADFQGCGEFNPMLIFSQTEEDAFSQAQDKSDRNSENAKNRRVMVLLFRKGTRVTPNKWPCPRAKEEVAGCRKRFFSDGEDRRSRHLADDRREFEKTQDTFACRFYDRLANLSPCERNWTGNGLLFMQCLSGDGGVVLAGRKYKIRGNGDPAVQYSGVLNDNGVLRHELVPEGDYKLSVQGCSDDANMVVLRMTDTIAQVQLLEDGILAIRVETPEGDGIPDAKVSVSRLPDRLTDDDGVAYFGSVPDGDYTFSASKNGFELVTAADSRQKSKSSQSIVGSGQPVGDTVGDPAADKVTVADRRVDGTVKLKKPPAPPPPPVPKVVRIEGRQIGTHSLRLPSNKLGDNTLRASTSSDQDLNTNKPVVLLKGSEFLQLTAITDPPGASVVWEITQNQTTQPIPDFDPKSGPEIEVKTDKVGSFAVAARLNGSVVFWNLVLVGIEIDTSSTSEGRNTGYVDLGSTPSRLGANDSFDKATFTGVSSGEFVFGKHAWSAQVTAKLTGGGPTGDLGCDRISVQILQNLVVDNVVGEYDTQLAMSNAGFRLLDTAKGSPEGWDGPSLGSGLIQGRPPRIGQKSPFLWPPGMFKVVSSGPRATVLQVGDSPAVAFKTRSPKNEKLQRIRGSTEFRSALAAFSKDSINSISVYADTVWLADYTGSVEISGNGEWSSKGAGTKIKQPWASFKDSNGVVGTKAWNALLEIFDPYATEKTNEDHVFIAKA